MSSNGTVDGFDGFNQPINFSLPDGTPATITMGDINSFAQYAVKVCINYGIQFGATAVMLAVIILLPKPDKAKNPIFLLNLLALVFNLIRTILQCTYYTSPWYHPYAVFTGDYSHITDRDMDTTLTTSAITFLTFLCIEVSLLLQVRVVCVTTSKIQRLAIMLVCCSAALVAIGFRFALTVINCEHARKFENLQDWAWLGSATQITTTVSICIFCSLFLIKLGYALVQRRKLGLKQFGPMQVIFIMGCQTMVIPVIFTGLQYTTNVYQFGSWVLTSVAIFLPLSALWAGASIDSRKQDSVASGSQRQLLGIGNGKIYKDVTITTDSSTLRSPSPFGVGRR